MDICEVPEFYKQSRGFLIIVTEFLVMQFQHFKLINQELRWELIYVPGLLTLQLFVQ